MEEREFTFLPKTLPSALTGCPSKDMLDVYIPATSEHAVLRIRKQGEKREITKKVPVSGDDSSHMMEHTIPLSHEEYEVLVTLPGKRVAKKRYYYTEDGVDYEFDVFQEALAGLVLVDVEFSSADTQSAFVLPQWCLADVTQEKFIAGGMLSGKAYKDIEQELARFAYTPLFV